MIIERMKIEDYDEIHQIWSNSTGITLRKIDDSKEGIARFLKRNPCNNFVCRFKEKIVGGILSGHDGRKGFIYHAVIIESHRHRGIGKRLVKAVVKSFEEENITKIGVFVNSDNPSGISFWDSLGFEGQSDLNYRILPLNKLNV